MDVKKYVIGKPRRILAIVNMLIWVPFATMLIVFEVQYHASIVNGIFLGLVILIINFFIAGPIIYSSGMWWSIDEEVFKYSSFRKFTARIKAFYLPKQQNSYFLALKVQQMDRIDLGWHDVPIFPFGLIGHPITFTITMKDGTTVELEALYTRESQKFVMACKHIESLGITLNDPYNLLEVIANPKRMISQYIDEIESGVHHD